MTSSELFSMCFSSAESSDLSAQNALDLLLNMSNARELVGNSLQVSSSKFQNGYMKDSIVFYKINEQKNNNSKIYLDCFSQVAVLKSDGKALEKGTWSTVTAASGQAQKILTFHVSENGETVLQEAYEAATSETGELTHIAIEGYEGGGDFSVVEQAAEEIRSPGYR